jgi:hypothetical protein
MKKLTKKYLKELGFKLIDPQYDLYEKDGCGFYLGNARYREELNKCINEKTNRVSPEFLRFRLLAKPFITNDNGIEVIRQSFLISKIIGGEKTYFETDGIFSKLNDLLFNINKEIPYLVCMKIYKEVCIREEKVNTFYQALETYLVKTIRLNKIFTLLNELID